MNIGLGYDVWQIIIRSKMDLLWTMLYETA